jgi:hypothetical protein
LYLERATIADRQGASEDQKFVSKPTQLNMNLFLANGISQDGQRFVEHHIWGDLPKTKGKLALSLKAGRTAGR